MTTISMRMPEDVIEELKEIAPKLGFSGYQPLMRAYIGRGLRSDVAELARHHEGEATERLIPPPGESLPAGSSSGMLYVLPPPELTPSPRDREQREAHKIGRLRERARHVGAS